MTRLNPGFRTGFTAMLPSLPGPDNPVFTGLGIAANVKPHPRQARLDKHFVLRVAPLMLVTQLQQSTRNRTILANR